MIIYLQLGFYPQCGLNIFPMDFLKVMSLPDGDITQKKIENIQRKFLSSSVDREKEDGSAKK